jgi:hypothetical protein
MDSAALPSMFAIGVLLSTSSGRPVWMFPAADGPMSSQIVE